MNINQINPFVRYIDIITLNKDYPEDTVAYDCRLFFILKGNSNAIIEEKEYKISKNSIIFFPPGTRYRFENKKNSFIELLVINFDFTNKYNYLVKPIIPDYESDYIHDKITESPQLENFQLPTCMNNMEFIKDDLIKMHQENCLKKRYYIERISALLKSVIISIARNMGTQRTPVPPVIYALIDYIHTNYKEEMSNKSLGKIFQYHPYYLNRLMKKHIGKTLHDYVRSYRISVASKLILTSNLPFDEIAYLTGFKNQSHFSQCFKKSFGMSPSKYKALNHKKLI